MNKSSPAMARTYEEWILFYKTFDDETWIRGLEIRPGNRKVVHHANVFILTPDAGNPDWSNFPEDLEAVEARTPPSALGRQVRETAASPHRTTGGWPRRAAAATRCAG
jgi:hypothetical protein